jgi:hypothetical protein
LCTSPPSLGVILIEKKHLYAISGILEISLFILRS